MGWEEGGGWGRGAWTSLTELGYGRSRCPKRGRSGNQTMTRACRGFDACTDAYVNFQHRVTWRIFVGENVHGDVAVSHIHFCSFWFSLTVFTSLATRSEQRAILFSFSLFFLLLLPLDLKSFHVGNVTVISQLSM